MGRMVEITDRLPYENWDENELPHGWAGELTYPNNIGFEAHFQLYIDAVEWVKENVINPYGNCKWVKLGDCIYIQFRKKKDMTWFALRFGA